MPQFDAKDLFTKYQAGQCTAEERAIVENWLTFGEATKLNLSEQELEQDLQELRMRLAAVPVKRVRLWPRIASVAAAVTAITLGVYFFKGESGVLKQVQDEVVVNDIAPGRSGATITLASGQVIQLSGAKKGVVIGENLIYDDGSEVQVSSGSQLSGSLKGSQRATGPVGDPSPLGAKNSMMLTASTSKGQTYELTLPDGTHVFLNADSKIVFPSRFIEEQRKILLSGEAYFVVKHDAQKPFRVVTTDAGGKAQIVEDIGTEFNINAYPDESTMKTTLVEGSAKVNEKVLIPNQQAINTGNYIKIKTVDPSFAIAWKKGKFMFKSEKISDVLKMVERWYDVEVVFADKNQGPGKVGDIKFTGGISRYENISKVLEMLETTGEFKFKVEGKKVMVSK